LGLWIGHQFLLLYQLVHELEVFCVEDESLDIEAFIIELHFLQELLHVLFVLIDGSLALVLLHSIVEEQVGVLGFIFVLHHAFALTHLRRAVLIATIAFSDDIFLLDIRHRTIIEFVPLLVIRDVLLALANEGVIVATICGSHVHHNTCELVLIIGIRVLLCNGSSLCLMKVLL
jgi:hypothetical protein